MRHSRRVWCIVDDPGRSRIWCCSVTVLYTTVLPFATCSWLVRSASAATREGTLTRVSVTSLPLRFCRCKLSHSWLWNPVGGPLHLETLQSSVTAALARLGLRCESKTPVRGMYVDVKLLDHPVIVEVDGPMHFAANLPDQRLGDTRMKHRLLRASGARLAVVQHFDWPRDEPTAQAQLLQKLLQKVGVKFWRVAAGGNGQKHRWEAVPVPVAQQGGVPISAAGGAASGGNDKAAVAATAAQREGKGGTRVARVATPVSRRTAPDALVKPVTATSQGQRRGEPDGAARVPQQQQRAAGAAASVVPGGSDDALPHDGAGAHCDDSVTQQGGAQPDHKRGEDEPELSAHGEAESSSDGVMDGNALDVVAQRGASLNVMQYRRGALSKQELLKKAATRKMMGTKRKK